MRISQNLPNNTDDNALSSIIGVFIILLIVVIFGTFVYATNSNMDKPDKAPQASLEADAINDNNGTYIEITHQGGDTLLSSDIKVTYTGENIDENLPVDKFSMGDTIYITGADVSDTINTPIITNISNTDSDVRVIDTESQQLLLNENPRFAFKRNEPDKAPQASLEADALETDSGDAYIEITHQGGDTLLASDTKITYGGTDLGDLSGELGTKNTDRFEAGESIYIGDTTVNSSSESISITDDNKDSDVRVIDTESQQLLLNENPRFAFKKNDPEKAPQASLEADAINDKDLDGDDTDEMYIEVVHQGGDSILESDTNIMYNGEPVASLTFPNDNKFDTGESIYIVNNGSDTIATDDSTKGTNDITEDADLRIMDTESQQMLLNENPRFA